MAFDAHDPHELHKYLTHIAHDPASEPYEPYAEQAYEEVSSQFAAGRDLRERLTNVQRGAPFAGMYDGPSISEDHGGGQPVSRETRARVAAGLPAEDPQITTLRHLTHAGPVMTAVGMPTLIARGRMTDRTEIDRLAAPTESLDAAAATFGSNPGEPAGAPVPWCRHPSSEIPPAAENGPAPRR